MWSKLYKVFFGVIGLWVIVAITNTVNLIYNQGKLKDAEMANQSLARGNIELARQIQYNEGMTLAMLAQDRNMTADYVTFMRGMYNESEDVKRELGRCVPASIMLRLRNYPSIAAAEKRAATSPGSPAQNNPLTDNTEGYCTSYLELISVIPQLYDIGTQHNSDKQRISGAITDYEKRQEEQKKGLFGIGK